MTKRRAHAFVFWLLPILVLRALMPVGTMLDVSSGTPNVVMCSEGFYKATTQSDAATSTHQQLTQHGDQHSVCPFAAALAAAPPVEDVFTADSFVSSATLESHIAGNRAAPGPSRIILTRGPPSQA